MASSPNVLDVQLIDNATTITNDNASVESEESGGDLPTEAALPALRSASALPDTRSARARRWHRLSSITIKNFKAKLKRLFL